MVTIVFLIIFYIYFYIMCIDQFMLSMHLDAVSAPHVSGKFCDNYYSLST